MALPVKTRNDLRPSKETAVSNVPRKIGRKFSYFWIAELKDGSSISQFNDDGSENKYALVVDQISADNVKGLYWVPFQQGKPAIGFDFGPGDKPIKGFGLFRRGYLTFGLGGGNRLDYVYVAGRIRPDGEKELVFIDRKHRTALASREDFDMKNLGGATDGHS